MVSPQKLKRYLLKVLTHPFLFLLYGCSHLFPRNKNLWVFGIQDRFAWSSKYLFLYTAREHAKEVQAVWISRDKKIVHELQEKGFPAYYWLSWQGLTYPLRAGWFMYDASVETINYWLSGGAKKVLLWHGIPLKKVEQDVKRGESIEVTVQQSKGLKRLAIRFVLPWRFVKPDYALSNSEFFREIYASAFGIAKEQVLTTGFPKNDVYFTEIPGAELGADREARELMRQLHTQGKKIVFYAPTWRDTGGESFLENQEPMENISRFLAEYNLCMFAKLHPLAKKAAGVGIKNISFVEPQSDADPLLKEVDILITDYSGIFFEFLLLDRPMVFFPYDYEKYVTRDRELYFDYNNVTPGPKAHTPKELLQRIEEVVKEDRYKEERRKVREMCYTWQDGNASERAYHAIKGLAL